MLVCKIILYRSIKHGIFYISQGWFKSLLKPYKLVQSPGEWKVVNFLFQFDLLVEPWYIS